MTDRIDLSGAPSEEDCAQVGTYADASEHSRHEALAYKAALIGVYGAPKEGYKLKTCANGHDFGTYYTVVLIAPADEGLRDFDYEDLLETGLRYWHQAMMPAPIDHANRRSTPICETSPSNEAIRRAIIASRPTNNGAAEIPLFNTVHRNLTAAYPEIAAETAATLAMIQVQEGATIQ